MRVPPPGEPDPQALHLGSSRGRYANLRLIAQILRVVGYITLAVAALNLLIVLAVLGDAGDAEGSEVARILIGLVVRVLAIALAGLLSLAVAELIRLALDTESNTRRAADTLAGAFRPPPQPEEPPDRGFDEPPRSPYDPE